MKPLTKKAIDLLLVLGSILALVLGLRMDLPAWYFAAAILAGLRTVGLLLRPSFGAGSIWLSSLLLIVAFFAAPPDLSDDYHRYLWEGFVQNEGYSPYLHSPDSLYPILDHPSENLVNHSDLPTIYPPLAQLFFRIAAWISHGVYSWKALILLSLAPLLFIMERRMVLIIASSPIFLFEGLWNGHLDALAVMPGFYLIHALGKRKARVAGALLAVLTALKIMPLILTPFCFFYLKGKDRLWLVGAFAVVMIGVYLPYLSQWEGLFGSFLKFSGEWYFNNPVFHGLKALIGSSARAILAIGFLISLAVLLWKPGPVEWKLICAWIAMILCSPTVHPWYLLWLLPLASTQKQYWVHISYMAVFLSYLILIPYRASGVWQERFWWMIPEWLALLFCFANLTRFTGFEGEKRETALA